MLAIVGWVVPEFWHLPAEMYSETNPLYAVSKVGWLPVIQILLFIAACEAQSVSKVYEKNCANPGNYGFDPFGLSKDPKKAHRYAISEIKNGRLAMIAIGGAIHHALLTNVGLVEQINSGKWCKWYSPFFFSPIVHLTLRLLPGTDQVVIFLCALFSGSRLCLRLFRFSWRILRALELTENLSDVFDFTIWPNHFLPDRLVMPCFPSGRPLWYNET